MPLISKKTRFIATTSKNLKQILRNNNFSSELFYSLSMYNIFTLPLRERKEDIKLLAKEIISEFNLINKIDKSISDDAFEVLDGMAEGWRHEGKFGELALLNMARVTSFYNNLSIR